MFSEKDLLRTIEKQKKRTKPLGTVRKKTPEILNFMNDKRILILSGIRRCGKSTILFQLMNKVNNYAYVNFEEEIFLDFKASNFPVLEKVLEKVYGNINIYFFDEIQVVNNFESFVRRLQDDGKKVIITGSNANLLSKEFASKLTGRHKSFEIFPFSFEEFLSFEKNKKRKKGTNIDSFENYLKKGGMPEYLENNDSEYIKDVYNSILYRDIITRYDIKKERPIREIIIYLVSNLSKQFTYNSLKKLAGLSNAITVKNYINYLQNSYFFFELQKFSESIKKQINSPKKIYLIDTSFYNILGTSFSENYGFILENLVFINLIRQKKEVFYYQDKGECDFVIRNKNKITQAIQVTKELSIGNKEREVNGLFEAMKKFNLKTGLILTRNTEDEITIDNKKIIVKPIWKWLLEN